MAKRLQRPSWRDSRLVVGLLLVLTATTIGAKVVSGADDRIPMYAARVALQPGDRLSADNLARVDVQLGDGVAAYLKVEGPLPADRYATRQVGAGELVPVAATGSAQDVTVQRVTVQVDALSAAALVVGSVVDVYVNERDPQATQEKYLDPKKTLESVTVTWLPQDTTRFGAGNATSAIQIAAPIGQVQRLIAAIDRKARVTVVPVAGSDLKKGP
ncbi:MAG TPA: hypothetical protein VHM65_03925 [Candidatus Lustribacter sp.]|nr:hypothetical protein [Candidatus Lustribacter sp.]